MPVPIAIKIPPIIRSLPVLTVMNIIRIQWTVTTVETGIIPGKVLPAITVTEMEMPIKAMMKQLIFIVSFVIISAGICGQVTQTIITGQVTFTGSQNIYVKFRSTKGISPGDTLLLQTNGISVPALVVSNLSSTSCVCSAIISAPINVADAVTAKVRISEEPSPQQAAPALLPGTEPADTVSSKNETKITELKQKIRGNISAYSYTDINNTGAANSMRFRYTLSMDARNIGNSRFSAESYISFRHKKGEWSEVSSDLFNALKIYSLAVKYEPDRKTQISFGRKINQKISSIGPIDGLQVERTVGIFSFGAVAGSRPDYNNYGFNPSLLQYGAYAAFRSGGENLTGETSFAVMQQNNNSVTDRRFFYFQHSNNYIRNLNMFGTFETDLYKLENGKAKNTFDVTGMYLSLRYKMSQKVSLSGSYDARKNVMYYETYKSYADSLFEKERRQGFRLQANYRITRDLSMGLQGGYRFMKSDPNPSRNAYGYVTYNRIPGTDITATASATLLQSAYLNGKIYGLNLYRDFLEGKLQAGLTYRYVDYSMPENKLDIIQHVPEANISWQFLKKMSLSVNYEATFESSNRYNRVYLQIRKRF
jgi:hypothetical protein